MILDIVSMLVFQTLPYDQCSKRMASLTFRELLPNFVIWILRHKNTTYWECIEYCTCDCKNQEFVYWPSIEQCSSIWSNKCHYHHEIPVLENGLSSYLHLDFFILTFFQRSYGGKQIYWYWDQCQREQGKTMMLLWRSWSHSVTATR